MVNKYLLLVSAISVSLAFIGGISVVGLLQSTERVGSSGIVIIPAPSRTTPQQPVTTTEIGVYSDFECTTIMPDIEWGPVEAGSTIGKIIYMKNSGDEEVILSLTTNNWIPSEAADYMNLTWDYDGSPLNSGDVLEMVFSLTIDTSIVGIDNFSFDIVIIGSSP